jgi:hypothetical protein
VRNGKSEKYDGRIKKDQRRAGAGGYGGNEELRRKN